MCFSSYFHGDCGWLGRVPVDHKAVHLWVKTLREYLPQVIGSSLLVRSTALLQPTEECKGREGIRSS